MLVLTYPKNMIDDYRVVNGGNEATLDLLEIPDERRRLY